MRTPLGRSRSRLQRRMGQGLDRRCRWPLVAILGALTLVPAQRAMAGDWAVDAGDDPAFAKTKALCVKARKTVLPPLAVAASVKPDCSGWDLYEGVGTAPDFSGARSCAARRLAQSGDSEAWLQGAGLLATLYANGQGVAQNYDVAIAYACEMEGAPAEMDGWLADLAKRQTGGGPSKPFDICDDVTSGAMGGFCAELQGQRADAARSVKLASLAGRVEAARKPLFEALQKAQQDFLTSSVDNEVDMSGTARGAMIVEAKGKQADAYLASLELVLAGTLPSISAAKLSEADRALNVVYGKIMKTKDDDVLGTVTKSGIKATQRKWLTYRNAFLALAGEPARRTALNDRLTRQRVGDLKDLLGEGQ